MQKKRQECAICVCTEDDEHTPVHHSLGGPVGDGTERNVRGRWNGLWNGRQRSRWPDPTWRRDWNWHWPLGDRGRASAPILRRQGTANRKQRSFGAVHVLPSPSLPLHWTTDRLVDDALMASALLRPAPRLPPGMFQLLPTFTCQPAIRYCSFKAIRSPVYCSVTLVGFGSGVFFSRSKS